jgi:NhaP-type Na+/H+ and K+/H+ antiporter
MRKYLNTLAFFLALMSGYLVGWIVGSSDGAKLVIDAKALHDRTWELLERAKEQCDETSYRPRDRGYSV